MKKLAVPFLVLSLAAFGCSSSSSNKDAGGGSGGSAGRGGSGGSTGGSGGSTGGSGGATGGSGGSAGRDGGGGSTADASNPDTLMASCTVVTDTTADQNMTLTAAVFCTNLLANCTGANLTVAYTGMTTCEAAYTASTRQHCQSYHLCWGVEGGGGGPALPNPHCSHAQGAGPCAPLADGAAGN